MGNALPGNGVGVGGEPWGKQKGGSSQGMGNFHRQAEFGLNLSHLEKKKSSETWGPDKRSIWNDSLAMACRDHWSRKET